MWEGNDFSRVCLSVCRGCPHMITCLNLFTWGPPPSWPCWQAGRWPSTERPSCFPYVPGNAINVFEGCLFPTGLPHFSNSGFPGTNSVFLDGNENNVLMAARHYNSMTLYYNPSGNTTDVLKQENPSEVL